MKNIVKALVLVAASAHLAAAPLLYASPAYALTGDVVLPSPYVSRALDAVLLPIDGTVRATFGLAAADKGVLVLATAPGGVADTQGIVPGDVIYQVRGHKILSPIELDEIVYYWLLQGDADFSFGYYRDGILATSAVLITLELYQEVIDISSVSSWTSWSTETSFSYSEFYEEYSVELTETYESSEVTIEETVTSEEFASEATEEYSEETLDESGDSDDDGVIDAEDGDDDGDGIDDAEDTDDDGDGVDDADDVDDGGDDGEDDGLDDGDDGGDEGDDSGDDEGDDGGDDGEE